MNWDRIEGPQSSYGIARHEAGKQIQDFEARCERDRWVQ